MCQCFFINLVKAIVGMVYIEKVAVFKDDRWIVIPFGIGRQCEAGGMG